jgi:hypothetical protein
VAARFREEFPHREAVVFVGKAQEKCTVYLTEKRHNPKNNTRYAWIVKSSALVNHYYFYCGDEDRPVFSQVLFLLPLQRQALPQRAPIRQGQLEREKISYQAWTTASGPASALRYADPMVQAIWNALLVFDLLQLVFLTANYTQQPALRG